MLNLKKFKEYNRLFYVRLFDNNVINPFVAYFFHLGNWNKTMINLSSYPAYNFPTVRFASIPRCPEHTWSFHPNIYDNGEICWGGATFPYGCRLIGILRSVTHLLRNPNHDFAPVPNRCGIS